MFERINKTRMRLTELSVVLDALISALVDKKVVSRKDIQNKILEGAGEEENASN